MCRVNLHWKCPSSVFKFITGGNIANVVKYVPALKFFMMAAVVVVKCLSLIVMSFLLLSDRYHRHDEDTKQNVLNKLDYIACLDTLCWGSATWGIHVCLTSGTLARICMDDLPQMWMFSWEWQHLCIVLIFFHYTYFSLFF